MLGRGFSLTRYFLVAGFFTAVIVAVAVSLFTGREAYRDLQDKSEDYAVLICRNLNRQVHERFVRPTVERDGYVDLERPEHLAALDAVVRLAIAELDVRDVYFFDLEGMIVYSTRLEHRGFRVSQNLLYDQAAAGEPSTALVLRGSPLDVGGQAGHGPLLETYVPIAKLDERGAPLPERAGVIEVYQDATELLEETLSARLRMGAISTAGVVSLMLALAFRIRQAQRTLEERARALLDANARLEALSHDLEGQVEDRTRRLLRAETLASVGTLAAGVAHEINNPIASIASCSEGLLRRAGAESLARDAAFADFPEYLQIIRDEAFRVKDITRNLLDFSRAGAALDGPLAEVDLGGLLQGTARLLAYRCESERKAIELETPQGPVTTLGDAASLRQLFLNVTVNALDASPQGRPVRWTLSPVEGGGALMTCSDEGRGLTPEELARAFEPFYTKKPVGQGTGLGLSIAYSIARRHGGSIELASAGEGRGATVTVRLAGRPQEEEGQRGE